VLARELPEESWQESCRNSWQESSRERAVRELAQSSCQKSCWEIPTWRTVIRELPGELTESWHKSGTRRDLPGELAQESCPERCL